MAFPYREDGRNGSSNTGYFAHFRQGLLSSSQFTISNPVANQRIAIETENINDSDVWLYGLTAGGVEEVLWTKVASTEGNNVIYNNIAKGIRNFYVVQTRQNDEISLVFADGTFGNIPAGGFRIYYRTSANRSMRIKPEELTNITFNLDYISRQGTLETLTIGCELKEQITNASTPESTALRQNAPKHITHKIEW